MDRPSLTKLKVPEAPRLKPPEAEIKERLGFSVRILLVTRRSRFDALRNKVQKRYEEKRINCLWGA
jgi:hypothetical protein